MEEQPTNSNRYVGCNASCNSSTARNRAQPVHHELPRTHDPSTWRQRKITVVSLGRYVSIFSPQKTCHQDKVQMATRRHQATRGFCLATGSSFFLCVKPMGNCGLSSYFNLDKRSSNFSGQPTVGFDTKWRSWLWLFFFSLEICVFVGHEKRKPFSVDSPNGRWTIWIWWVIMWTNGGEKTKAKTQSENIQQH